MTTYVEIFHDEESVLDNAPVAVEVWPNAEPTIVDVVVAGPPTQTTDPVSGMPFAVMWGGGKNIYVSSVPPPVAEFPGDIWIPKPA